jgi:hypothetical protein
MRIGCLSHRCRSNFRPSHRNTVIGQYFPAQSDISIWANSDSLSGVYKIGSQYKLLNSDEVPAQCRSDSSPESANILALEPKIKEIVDDHLRIACR